MRFSKMDNKILTLEEKEANVKKWVTFFRRNIHRFIEMYFGIKLYPHQRLEFYAMGTNTNYVEVASRGTAKSWKAGVFALAWGVLYPNSEIVIVSESKKQAGVIIEKKIKPLKSKYENVDKEIESITTNDNNMEVVLRNGSIIFVVPLRETARGNRNTICIREERRLLDNKKLNSIIAPMAHPRQAEYLKNPKFSHLVEEPRTISITSSGRDTEEWYKDVDEALKASFLGEDSICLFADYLLGLRYGMQTIQQIEQEKKRMDSETFSIEYENMLIRENKDSFFQHSLIDSARVIKNAYYPQRASDYNPTKNIYAIPKVEGEKIIVAVDIALKSSLNNDNTIIHIDRLIPTKDGYEHNIVYTESMHGKNTLFQALRIKQLFMDFGANYIVLDCAGNGIGVYDSLTEKTIDDVRGVEYHAMTSIRHNSISKYEDYVQRTKAINAIPVIYPMVAGEAINSEAHFLVRDLLKKDMIKLPCSPNEGEEYLYSRARYFDAKKDSEHLNFFMRPYYQASELESEMTLLKPTYSGNLVKLEEPYNGRKDRYMALAYACWVTKIVFDPEIVKEKQVYDYTKQVCVSSGVSQSVSNNGPRRFGGTHNNTGGRRRLFGR
jgi:hypothetical protein